MVGDISDRGLMVMFYNTAPRIKARAAYKTRNRILVTTATLDGASLYWPCNDVSTAHAY